MEICQDRHPWIARPLISYGLASDVCKLVVCFADIISRPAPTFHLDQEVPPGRTAPEGRRLLLCILHWAATLSLIFCLHGFTATAVKTRGFFFLDTVNAVARMGVVSLGVGFIIPWTSSAGV